MSETKQDDTPEPTMSEVMQMLRSMASGINSVAEQVSDLATRIIVLETEPRQGLLHQETPSKPAKPEKQDSKESSPAKSEKDSATADQVAVPQKKPEASKATKSAAPSGQPSGSDSSDEESDFPNWFADEHNLGFDKIYAKDDDGKFEGSPKDAGKGSGGGGDKGGDKNSQKAEAKKRTTMFERSAQHVQTAGRTLNFQALQPDYTHIRLSSLQVSAIYTFFEELQRYQESYLLDLEAPALLSSSLQLRIKAKFRLTNEVYNHLSDTMLYNCVRSFILPESRLDFIRVINLAVPFTLRANFVPTAENFRTFYNALLDYRYTFTKVYEMLADNNGDNVPESKNKPGGLIKCFIDKIPHEYGTRVFQNLPGEQFQRIYTFLRRFYKVVEEHRKYHEYARKLMLSFGGTAFEAARRSDIKHLNNIDIEHGDEEDELHRSVEPYDPAPVEDTEYEPHYSDGEEVEGASDFDEELAAMQGAPARTQPPQRPQTGPCWTKVNTGKCTKMGCTYLHSGPELIKAREQKIQDLLQLQKGLPPKVSVSNQRQK